MAAYIPELPMGYRFCPTEEELITYYLAKKVFAPSELPQDIIKEVDLYKYSPQELQEIYGVSNEKELFVWTQRERKYVNGNRPSRRAGNGTWRATTNEKKIFDDNGDIIGYKNTLEYREDHGEGRKGKKTNWLMYEYKLTSNNASSTSQVDDPMKMNEWMLCKIYLNKQNCRNLQNTTARPEETSHGQNLEHLQGGPRDIHNYVNDPDQLETHDVPNRIPHHHVQYYLNNMKYTQVTDQNLKETNYQNMEEKYQNTPVFGLQVSNSTSYYPHFSNMEHIQAGQSNVPNIVNAPHQNQLEVDHILNQIPLNTDQDDHVHYRPTYLDNTQVLVKNLEEKVHQNLEGTNQNTPVFGLQITNSTSNDPSFSDMELTQAGPSNNDLNVNAPHQNQSEANMHNQIPINIDRDDYVRHADYPETIQKSHQNPEENLELVQVGLNDNNIAPHQNQFQDDHVHYPIFLDNIQVSDKNPEEIIHQNLEVTHQTLVIDAYTSNMEYYLQASGRGNNILNVSGAHQNKLEAHIQNEIIVSPIQYHDYYLNTR